MEPEGCTYCDPDSGRVGGNVERVGVLEVDGIRAWAETEFGSLEF